MDERTMLYLVSFYEAVSKTNYDYMRNKYFYVIIAIIVVLFFTIIYMYFNPRIKSEIKYIPYIVNNQQQNYV